MYKTRRRNYRRKTFRRKKYGRKRVYSRRRRSAWSRPLSVKRVVYQKLMITGNDTTSFGYGALSFALNDLPNYTEYTNLYDFFRITGVKLRFRMTQDRASTASNQGQKPTLIVARDYNDTAAWSSITDAAQYPKFKYLLFSHDGNQMYQASMFLRPAVLTNTYKTAVSSGYSANWKAKVSTVDYSCPFYGLKYAYERLFAGYSIEVHATYYVKFWNPI